jgi:amino acid adenylation domain-containing protein
VTTNEAMPQMPRPIEDKRALLARLLKERSGQLACYPLSPAQQRIWFLEQLHPASGAYNIHDAIRIDGVLDAAILDSSLQRIVRRHAALRTSIVAISGQPMQLVMPERPIMLARSDLRTLLDDDRAEELERISVEQAERPFDLVGEPLLRTTLVRLEETSHILLLTMHHIISDGWSLGILLDELMACYDAYAGGTAPQLAELPIQYADYAVWERQRSASDALRSKAAQWADRLRDAVPLDLPTDHPRPAVQSFAGARERIVVSAELARALVTLSRREGASLFMLLFAAFDALVYLYSRQTDIMVGTPVAGRRRTDVEHIIGLFTNTLVLRVDLAGRPRFIELLAQVRALVLDAYSHEDVPLDLVIEQLQLPRDISRNPLFQAMFILHNEPGWQRRYGALHLTSLDVDRRSSKVDLTVAIQNSDGLTIAFEYNTALFQRATIRRMLEQYRQLLAAIVASPDQYLDELLSFSSAQQSALRVRPELLKRLPSDRHKQMPPEPTFLAPRIDIEQMIATVWSQVLGVEQIGVEDNFFALGGDSIRSVQVIASLHERGIGCSLQQLFQHQTIAALVNVLGQNDRTCVDEEIMPYGLLMAEDGKCLPAGLDDAYPLTMLQLGMLYHSELRHDSAMYRYTAAVRIRARLDPSHLALAANRVVRAHPVLRVSFDLSTFSEPLQLVHHAAAVPFEAHDLRGFSAIEQQQTLQRWWEDERSRPFEWSQAPLIRFTLYRLDDDMFQLGFSTHHAILDGWSVATMLVEIFGHTFSQARARRWSQPSPTYRFASLVAAERRTVTDQAQREFWATKLLGSTLAKLPRWPNVMRGRISPPSQSVAVEQEVLDGLVTTARRLGVPLKSVLLAAHFGVLRLLTNQTDLVTGLVCNSRPETNDAERVLGVFLNTAPLRLFLPRGSWADLARAVFEAECELLPFRTYPLARLLHDLKQPAFFETAFNFIHYHVYGQLAEIEDLQVLEMVSQSDPHFALDVTFRLEEAQLYLSLAHDDAELCTEQVVAIGQYFCAALAQLADAPDALYEPSRLLPPAERRWLLSELNSTYAPYPTDACVHHLFEAQVRRTPDAVAVVGGVQTMCYRELDEQANRLAFHLRGLGVGLETPVGLCVDRSPAMLVGALGILKAGGYYVPLDPVFPTQRLALMIRDSGMPLIVTEQRIRDSLAAWAVPTLCLDDDSDAVIPDDRPDQLASVGPTNLAYTIYTSGSTGAPKGVQISHASVVNFLASMQRCPGFSSQDILLAVTTISFDIAALELFLPLMVGARVVIAPREVIGDGEALLTLIRTCRATILQATPTTWRLLLEAGFSANDRVRMLCGGEALRPDLAAQLLETGTPLWNLYGPTETTIWSAVAAIEHVVPPITVGRPIANTQICILDAQLQPVPTGVAGEIYIGGHGLARGYSNRPDLTGERFIPDPFGVAPGGRLYRTGDRGRHLADGRVEVLGRVDQQVKVRGFRIELGEIETAIGQHPSVGAAAVVVQENASANQLVAYLSAAPGCTLPEGAMLRQFLRVKLPEYMIPTIFVALDQLPLTPNGKIDRHALPWPLPDQLTPTPFIPPSNPTEAAVAELWQQVFHLPQIDADDNFFDLGGHSLLAMQLIARLRSHFRIHLPLRSLFEAPTVVQLSARVQNELGRQAAPTPHAPPPTVSGGGVAPKNGPARFPLSFGQERVWFLTQLMPESPFYTMATGVRIRGALDVVALRHSFVELVKRHASLRTAIVIEQGLPIQAVAAQAHLTFDIIDARCLPLGEREAQINALAEQAARAPFDLGTGQLLHVLLIELADDERAIVLTMHHIISDSWSMGVLFRELEALYTASVQHSSASLPIFDTQPGDFALWQRGQEYAAHLAPLLDYWEQRLMNPPPTLALPTDRPRPPVQSFNGATYRQCLSSDQRDALDRLCRREQVTPFILLVSVYAVLLARYSGQTDVLIGIPTNGRTMGMTENLVGFFVNTLVLRLDLADNPSFRTFLAQARDTAIEAFTHDDIPFERLVERLRITRDLSRNPLFQVMFSYRQSTPLRLPSLDVSGFPIETGTAKFDLSLEAVDRPDGLWLEFEYSSDLFDASTIARLARHFATLLEGVLLDPTAHVEALELLYPEEQRALLVASQCGVLDEAPVYLHKRFEIAASRMPDAEAITVFSADRSSAVERITYGDLNHEANRVAWHLLALGVGLETRVGICLGRSVETIAAVLGVLKAGGAYVPLDPQYPQERLEYMLRDARTHVLLTSTSLANRFISHTAAIVCVDDMTGLTPLEADQPPVVQVMPENLAYVVYTSGSTGQPKGVMVTHRGLAQVYRGWEHAYGLPDAAHAHLQLASFSFDVFTGDLTRALGSGTRLVICPREWLLNPRQMYQLICAEHIECAEFVPAVLMPLVTYLECSGERLDHMRLLICGSDTLRTADYQRIKRVCGAETRVINSYGLSEATIDSAFFEGEPYALRGETVPIGRPFDGAELYVLDPQMRLTPIGVPGELYVGGVGLARGYLGKPGLTGERLVPHPFTNQPGARLYRTGDRARLLSDGTVTLLGRTDDQVKIHGLRIELDEITAALCMHPAVRECAVAVRIHGRVGDVLVAYVVPLREAPPAEELLLFLRQRLPTFMVPAAFLFLDALPLTPNGKVDRNALPPLADGVIQQNKYVAPRDDAEHSLVALWEELLGVTPIGVTTDFFALGGHSLLAAQLITWIGERFHFSVPLCALFERPTIEQLADLLRHGSSAGEDPNPRL